MITLILWVTIIAEAGTAVSRTQWPDPNKDPLVFVANPVEAVMPGHWVPLSIVKVILEGTSTMAPTVTSIKQVMSFPEPKPVPAPPADPPPAPEDPPPPPPPPPPEEPAADPPAEPEPEPEPETEAPAEPTEAPAEETEAPAEETEAPAAEEDPPPPAKKKKPKKVVDDHANVNFKLKK